MALEGGFNIGDVDPRDSTSIIDSTANIQRDIILDSTHTPRRWIQTWTTGFLQYRPPGTNSIDDCRMTSDVLHQMYPAVDQHILDRPTLQQTTNILREDPPDSSSSRGSPGPIPWFIHVGCYIISLYFLMVIMILEWQDLGPLRARDKLWS